MKVVGRLGIKKRGERLQQSFLLAKKPCFGKFWLFVFP
jgi:hypothetical protein